MRRIVHVYDPLVQLVEDPMLARRVSIVFQRLRERLASGTDFLVPSQSFSASRIQQAMKKFADADLVKISSITPGKPRKFFSKLRGGWIAVWVKCSAVGVFIAGALICRQFQAEEPRFIDRTLILGMMLFVVFVALALTLQWLKGDIKSLVEHVTSQRPGFNEAVRKTLEQFWGHQRMSPELCLGPCLGQALREVLRQALPPEDVEDFVQAYLSAIVHLLVAAVVRDEAMVDRLLPLVDLLSNGVIVLGRDPLETRQWYVLLARSKPA